MGSNSKNILDVAKDMFPNGPRGGSRTLKEIFGENVGFDYPILDQYMKENSVARDNISSYDYFIEMKVRDAFEQQSNIRTVLKDSIYSDSSEDFRIVEISFGTIRFEKPMITSINEGEEVRKPMYPNMARLLLKSYSATIYCDVLVTYYLAPARFRGIKDVRVIPTEEMVTQNIEQFNNCIIGHLPVLLGSSLCHTRGLTREQLASIDECHYEVGGYFIIDGRERFLSGFDRAAKNEIFVLEQKNKDGYRVETRSILEKSGYTVSTQAHIAFKTEKIKVIPACLKQEISAFTMLAAFNMNEENVKHLIMCGLKGATFSQLTHADEIIERNLVSMPTIEMAREILASRIYEKRNTSYRRQIHAEINLNDTVTDDEYKRYALERYMSTEVFPHVTTDVRGKGYHLIHMIQRLLRVYIGLDEVTDRDHCGLKRIDISGHHLSDLFRENITQVYGRTVRAMLSRHTKPNVPDILYNASSIHKLIVSNMKQSKWTAVRGEVNSKVGVPQQLKFFSNMHKLAFLRKIHVPSKKNSKANKARFIHNSQRGYVDIVETPEGDDVGFVKTLGLTCRVTSGYPRVRVQMQLDNLLTSDRTFIEGMNYWWLQVHSPNGLECKYDWPDNADEIFAKGCRVYLNGDWIISFRLPLAQLHRKLTQLFNKLRLVFPEISVCPQRRYNIIKIYSDASRMIRPLIPIDRRTNAPLINPKHPLPEGTTIDDLLRSGKLRFLSPEEEESEIVATNIEDLDKMKATYLEIAPQTLLGVSSALIPMSERNPAPRNTYQAAMGKQAIGTYVSNYRQRFDISSMHILNYTQRPMLGTSTAAHANMNTLPGGVNLVVAVLSWTGFNQEDSVILNKSAIDRGLFRSTNFRSFSTKEATKDSVSTIIRLPSEEEKTRFNGIGFSDRLDKRGIVKKGTKVSVGDVLISQVAMDASIREGSDASIRVGKDDGGFVDETFYSDDHRVASVRIRKPMIPVVGDKFASRSAQKGVVGAMYPQEDMPFCEITGITPDLIINPNAIPSRMTMSQILETLIGKATCYSDGGSEDVSTFRWTDDMTKDAEKLLVSRGFNRDGWQTLRDGKTGKALAGGKVYTGVVYYQRLKHLVKDKIHARARGGHQLLVRQPLEGRAHNGGLRVGEMERDALVALGTSANLQERLFRVSDQFKIQVCKTCKIPAAHSGCSSCRSRDQVYDVEIPYASKLLMQELTAMGIGIKYNID